MASPGSLWSTSPFLPPPSHADLATQMERRQQVRPSPPSPLQRALIAPANSISYDSSDPSLLIRPEPTLEPFLLASEPDLEEEVSTTDTSGTLYLRPFSRVFLAQKLEVLGVPNLAVYHVKSRKMLSTHARIEMIKGDKADATWNKWQAGEGVDFAFGGAFSVFPRQEGADPVLLRRLRPRA